MRQTTGSHVAVLDGLRAAAIALVLLYHLTPMRNPNLGLIALPFKLATIGWSGVDLFFVLSGFLITTKLLAARDDEHRFRDFYVRRALRIFPLYYGVLLVLMLIGRPPLAAQLPYWLYYSNFTAHALPTDPIAPIGHFWSLAIEEQFYLVWPAIIFFCRKRTAMSLCIAIAIASPLLRFVLASQGFAWNATYGWTCSRADGLVLGALIAIAGTSKRLAWIAIVATTPFLAWVIWRDKATTVVITNATDTGVLLRTLLPTAVSLFFAAVLMLALEHRPRILELKPLRAIATYSYGMYVFHFMLVPTLTRVLPLEGLSRNVAATVMFVVGSIASFVCGAISYHAYESFFLRMKSRFA